MKMSTQHMAEISIVEQGAFSPPPYEMRRREGIPEPKSME
uniref:Uncharacterized protein n=1 Tax=Anguilla anguilla TaxID=7936 RepID=A0A0E9TVR8_ANGAN